MSRDVHDRTTARRDCTSSLWAGRSDGATHRPKRRNFNSLVVAACVCAAAIHAPLAHADGARLVPYEDEIGEVVRLSNETERPFLFGGKIPAAEPHMQGTYNLYKGDIERYSDVTGCLNESERKASQPNLAKFNWAALETEESVKVCLFRIADSYGTPDVFLRWLQAQGFSTTLSRRTTWKTDSQEINVQAVVLLLSDSDHLYFDFDRKIPENTWENYDTCRLYRTVLVSFLIGKGPQYSGLYRAKC